MGTDDTEDPKIRLVHYITYGIYRVFEFMLKPFPIGLVCVAGGVFGLFGSIILPQRRNIVIRNLRIVYGDKLSLTEIESMCRRTYWNAGANLMASLRANHMSTDELNECMDISGIENLDTTPTQGTGFIILLSHMGSWETLVQMPFIVSQLSPFGALYRPLGNPLLDKLVKRRREQTGIKLFSRKDGFFAPITHLKEKGTLGAFADQNAGNHGLSVPMFGKLTSLTSLPALLHRRTSAPIIPVSMSTVSNGKWHITVHPPIDISDDERTNAALTTSRCARSFETMMSKSPTDVLWMHSYWKVGRKQPLKISGSQKEKNALLIAPPIKPFKLLVFAGDIPADSQEALTQLKRLKQYRPDIEITLVSEFLTSPDVDQRIPMYADEPPHIVANQIRNYDLEMQTPIDCALDFTTDAKGGLILKLSGITARFAMKGKRVSPMTKRLFKNPEKRNLSGFLESLGINRKRS